MKITKQQLRKIIKEETRNLANEAYGEAETYWVVHHRTEEDEDAEDPKRPYLYWSNDWGWGSFKGAAAWSAAEKSEANLPTEGEWEELPANYVDPQKMVVAESKYKREGNFNRTALREEKNKTKITKQQLRKIIKEELLKETQWGGFTGGAAPLDPDPVDRGPIPSGQLNQLFDLLVDMGKPVEDILAMPEFVEAGITSLEDLRR